MTACAIEPAAEHENHENTARENRRAPRTACVITADGAYAARLARDGDSWFPERWTLDGPEPYAVPLPGNQPEEPGTEVLPMADGRVLIRRPTEGRHTFSLLYPTGPGTGELPLGAVECPDDAPSCACFRPRRAASVRTPSPWARDDGGVAGGGRRLRPRARGRDPRPVLAAGCGWTARAGMLALDRESGGRTKAVVVDLERGGEVSPLLQISADSDDRLLLADPDSGLLLISSDALRRERTGWAGGCWAACCRSASRSPCG